MTANTDLSWWVDNVLAKHMNRLCRDLAGVLPGQRRQQECFIEAAGEAIDEYRKIRLPEQTAAGARDDRIASLESAALRFAAAVKALDVYARERLMWGQWTVEGRAVDVPSFDPVVAAAATARQVAASAQRLRKAHSERGVNGRAARGLIRDIAVAYDAAFGERPSGARNGVFARALRDLFQAGGVGIEIGERSGGARNGHVLVAESKLSSIIRETPFRSPPLKRGRKARR